MNENPNINENNLNNSGANLNQVPLNSTPQLETLNSTPPVVEPLVNPTEQVATPAAPLSETQEPIIGEVQQNIVSLDQSTTDANTPSVTESLVATPTNSGEQSGENQTNTLLSDTPITSTSDLVTPPKEPKNKKGIIGIVIIFVILIGAIIGLPYITEYLENRNEKVVNPSPNPNNENPNPNGEEPKPSDDLPAVYVIEPDTKFVFEGLDVTSIRLVEEDNDYYIRFIVKNTNTTNINLADKNYYLELYTEDNTFLERVKLDDSIVAGVSEGKYYLISADTFTKARVLNMVAKTTTDYPDVALNEDVEKNSNLVCRNGGSTITYTFNNKQLKNIKDTFTMTSTDTEEMNYQIILTNYQNLIANYAIIDGVSATLVPSISATASSFTTNIEIDLATAKVDSISNRNYYKLDTSAKIVKFEMEAMRYTCS